MPSLKIVRKIAEKTNYKCYYCGCDLPENTNILDWGGKSVISIRNWDIEHMIPKSRGGSNKVENLVPSCKPCNRKKFMKTSEEFING